MPSGSAEPSDSSRSTVSSEAVPVTVMILDSVGVMCFALAVEFAWRRRWSGLYTPVLGWFYLTVLPGWLGLEQQALDVSMWDIAKSVLTFLGIPLLAGYLSRRIGESRWGRRAYAEKYLPRIGPWALYGWLFTVVILFALQGEQITSHPLDVVRIAVPLLAYFTLMWGLGYLLGRALGMSYERTATLAFTAAGNNYELAIAVAIATFGVRSGQALAGTVGPLIEMPVMVGLVYVSLFLQRRFPHPKES